MISVIPVHKLTASFQYDVVLDAARKVEGAGGVVLGSITDNHKINQQYCTMFSRPTYCPASATHPLDQNRVWHLLFDSVHLLKCIRNNWISEKCQTLSLDQRCVGSFQDVIDLYNKEKESILKTSPLTQAAVKPSKLQLQNVQHVLKVFNEKVVAALKLQGCKDTAAFIDIILQWWNVMNVSSKGQHIRLNDPNRQPQTKESSNLKYFLDIFEHCESGHGSSRKQCFTHDTRKALIQTMYGMIALCTHLLSSGFEYVLLREIQSDRIEGEFGVYRQSTGANAFMTAGNVINASKKRLARYAAGYLETLNFSNEKVTNHTCVENAFSIDDARVQETIYSREADLSANELASCAYVAGWLEQKCTLEYDDEDPLVDSEISSFITEVSRGQLCIPHESTFEIVQQGLCFMNLAKQRVCCRQRLEIVLSRLYSYIPSSSEKPSKFFRHLSNVLLSGLHNLERDHQKNATLLQTSIKKARLMD